MSGEFDIYADLDNYDSDQVLKTKSNELLILQEKYNSSIETIKDLQIENKELQKKVRNIEKSFWSLLETAKIEINRKDRQNSELRREVDNITFRRNNRSQNKSGERSVTTELNKKPNIQINPFRKESNEEISFTEKKFSSNKNHEKTETNIFCQEKESISDKILGDDNSKTVIKTNESLNVSPEKSTKKIKEDLIKLELMKDVKKVRKKLKCNKNEEKKLKESVVSHNEHTAKNFEDLIFDEMLDQKCSLNIKSGVENLYDDLESDFNNKNAQISKVGKSNIHDTTKENTMYKPDDINISMIEENYKTSKTNDTNENSVEEVQLKHMCKETNNKTGSPYNSNGENIDEDKGIIFMENKSNDDVEILIQLNVKDGKIDSLVDQEPVFNKNDVAEDSKNETNLQIKQNETQTVTENILNVLDNMINQMNMKENSKNVKITEENINLNSDKTYLTPNKVSRKFSSNKLKNKLIGHKIDGFEHENNEQQVLEASNLKKTLFKEIITENKLIDVNLNGNVDTNLECNISPSNVEENYDDQSIEIINETVEFKEKIFSESFEELNIKENVEEKNLEINKISSIDKEISNILDSFGKINCVKSHLNQDMELSINKEDNESKNTGLSLKNLNIFTQIENIEDELILRKPNNISPHPEDSEKRKNKKSPSELENMNTYTFTEYKSETKINLETDLKEIAEKNESQSELECINTSVERKNDVDSLDFEEAPKIFTRINILENIQIAPPTDDLNHYSTKFIEHIDENSKLEYQTNFDKDILTTCLDIKPDILKPNVSIILPLLNNSVEMNKAAADELVKILGNTPKCILTPRKLNLNSKAAMESSVSSTTNEINLLPKTPSKNISPNQSETLEATTFLTDNLLINTSANNSLTNKLNELFGETPLHNNTDILNININQPKYFENTEFKEFNYNTNLEKNSSEIKNKESINTPKKCKGNESTKNGSKTEKYKSRKMGNNSIKLKISKKTKNSSKQNSNLYYSNTTLDANESNENQLIKTEELTTINGMHVTENKEDNIENLFNSAISNNNEIIKIENEIHAKNRQFENKTSSNLSLIEVDSTEINMFLDLVRQKTSNAINLKNDILFDTNYLLNSTENRKILKVNKTDSVLQKQIDDIFGKSPFNEDYTQANISIAFDNINNAKENISDQSSELNTSNSSLHNLSTSTKNYEMVVDNDGTPIWNITKIENRKRKKKILVNESNDNNNKKFKKDDNCENKNVTNENDKIMVNIIKNNNNDYSNKFQHFPENIKTVANNLNVSEKDKINVLKEVRNKSLSSFKIPKKSEKRIGDKKEFSNKNQPHILNAKDKNEPVVTKNDELNLENSKFDENKQNMCIIELTPVDSSVEICKDPSEGNEKLIKQFKSPKEVEPNLNKICDNDIENEFLRIFGKSPNVSRDIDQKESICTDSLDGEPENSENIIENLDYSKEYKSDKNRSLVTEHNISKCKRTFSTSSKAYEMHCDETDGTINWIIKRKKKKKPKLN